MRKGELVLSYWDLLTISAILAFVFGLGFVSIPGPLSRLYNVQIAGAGLLFAQLYGGTLLGFGLLNWFGRGFSESSARQAVVTANFVGDALGFIFSLIGQLGGVPEVNALGWSTVLIYLLLTLGFGYLRFFTRWASLPYPSEITIPSIFPNGSLDCPISPGPWCPRREGLGLASSEFSGIGAESRWSRQLEKGFLRPLAIRGRAI